MRSFLFLLVLLVSACITPAQRFVKTVNSWADLLSLNPNDVHTNAFVVYGTTVGDEQGGIFTYFSNSSEDTNLQTVLKPYSYNGRWIKQAGNFLTNTYVTNLYASNIYTTNLTVVNLISNYVTTNITLETLYVTNLFATNATFYTTNITIRGERVRVYTFDTNQFDATVQINPVVTAINIKNGANVTNLTSQTRLIAQSVFAMGAGAYAQIASAATNSVATASSSWIDMDSDSAVPGARVLSLDAGANNGQMLVIRNVGGANTFTLPNSSLVTGGGQVNLAGADWQAKPGEAILLIYDESFQDWNEIGRFGSGTTAGLVANLTPGYIPYATSTNTLGDSPFYRSSANVIGFGGTTPLLTAYNTTGDTNSIIVAWDISTPPAANSVVLGNTNVSGVYIGKAVRVNGNRIGIGTDALKAAPSPTSAVVIGNNSVPLVSNPLYSVVLGNNAAPVASSLQHFVSVGNLNGSNLLVSNQDTLLGSFAGYYMTNSQQSVLIGYDVATKLTNSINNTIVGAETVRSNTFGRENTIIGYGAMNTPTNIERTVIVGTVDTTRSPVTLVGSVTDSVFIGFKSNNVFNAASGFNNVVSIGAGVLPSGDNTIAIGNTNVASLYLGKVGKVGSSFVGLGTDAMKGATSINSVGLGDQSLGGGSAAGNGNTGVGFYTLRAVTTGEGNTAVGNSAGYQITTGDNNTGIGSGALLNAVDGGYNVAIGSNAGQDLVSGDDNIFIGTTAGENIETGSYNIALGVNALGAYGAGVSGSYNVAIGSTALGNSENSYNVAVGNAAAANTRSSTGIVSVGASAGPSEANYGTYVGSNAGEYDVSTLGYNTFVGYHSGLVNTNDSYNTFLGALTGTQTGPSGTVTNAIAIGVSVSPSVSNQMVIGNTNNTSLYVGNVAKVNPVYYITAFGKDAGKALTTGQQNVFVGEDTGKTATTESENVAVGTGAMAAGSGYFQSVAVGNSALYYGGGGGNTAVGAASGNLLTTGIQNTLLGYLSGQLTTSGSYNNYIGAYAGMSNLLGNYNVLLGHYASGFRTNIEKVVVIGGSADANTNNWDTVSNAIAIGADTQLRGNNTAQIGTNGITVLYLNGTVGWYRGSGSPEGAVTATVGSFYSREDGGVGSSFYVKETGTGNTGWAAK